MTADPVVRCRRLAGLLARVSPAELSGVNLAAALGLAKAMGEWVKAVEERAKERLTAGEDVPGWMTRPTGPERYIEDLFAAYARAELPLKDFLGCCKVSVPKLEQAIVASALRQSPVTAGDAEVRRRLEGLVKRKAKRAALERDPAPGTA